MLFAEIADKLSDFDNLLRIKTYRRLVKNDYGRIAEKRLSKTYTLATLFTRLIVEQRLRMGQVLAVTYTEAATQELRLHGCPLALPPKPLRLAAELLAQPRRVFSRLRLGIAVWGHEQDSSDTLRSVLHTLRRALGDDASTRVVNVHGLGYKLVGR